MDNTVDDDKLIFPPLDRCCLLRTYQIYSAEHAGWFVAQHADLTVRSMSWKSVIAAGAKKELDLLWKWQLENRGHWRDRATAVFELHILGDEKVLGMEFGYDGTKLIYLSSVDLSRSGYFYDPIATLLGNRPHADAGDAQMIGIRIPFPSCYGPRPLIPAPFLVGRPIPDAVWQMCRMMHELLPTQGWPLVATGRGRVKRRSFPLGQRRFAALWVTECIYGGMTVMLQHDLDVPKKNGDLLSIK